MTTKTKLSVAIAGLSFLGSAASAQIISETFSSPTTVSNSGAEASFGTGGAGYAYGSNFGTWIYNNGNMGINNAAEGDGLGGSNGNSISSIGMARAQDERGTNARAASVVYDGSAFTNGDTYTVSFDVIGDLGGNNAGRYWFAALNDTDAGGSNYVQVDGTQNTWNSINPYTAIGDATVSYFQENILLDGDTIAGPTAVSFDFTYISGDLAFSVGTFNNVFAIDNFQISAVPESSSYALLAGCLALASVMVRRRR